MKTLYCIIFFLLAACHAPENKTAQDAPKNDVSDSAPRQNIYMVDNGGCLYVDSITIDSIGHHLFRDQKGNLYFKTYDRSEPKKVIPVLISRLYNGWEGDSSYDLRRNVDAATFRYLDGNYYKDTNHVFIFNQMHDGGNLVIFEEVDLKTFKTYPGSFYAADKRHVYYMGRLVKKADPRTFQCIYKYDKDDTLCLYGKDSRAYFSGENKCSKAEVDAFLKN